MDKIKKWLKKKNTRNDFNDFVSKYKSNAKTLVVESHDCDYQLFFTNYTRVRNRGGDDVEVILPNYHKLPFTDESFDIVVATGVLEHIKKPSLFIKEAHRVLRRDGLFLVTSSFVFPSHNTPQDYFHMTKYGLAVLLEDFSSVKTFESSSTMKGLAVIIHRIAYQTKIFFPVKVLFFLMAKLIPYLQFLIKEEYGNRGDKPHKIKSIMSANVFGEAIK
jgi:ubiquinone/menaquinone biosynthesis C-methylase UbiE